MNMTPFYTPSRSTNRVGSFIPHATPPGLDNGNEMTPEDSYLSRPRHLVPQGHHNTPPRSNEHQEVQRLRQEVDTLRGEVDSLRQQVGVKEKQPSKKIPPELSVKVKHIHSNLENQFQPSQSYRSICNQDVVREVCDQILQNDTLKFDDSIVKRAVYRYYESRRKAHNDSRPQRQAAVSVNKKQSQKTQERKRLYDRRAKMVKESEKGVWKLLSPICMSDESDGEDSTCAKIKIRHTPIWRSERLNIFLHKLDKRTENKLGAIASRCIQRTYGTPRIVPPPKSPPRWMLKGTHGPENTVTDSTPTQNPSPSYYGDMPQNIQNPPPSCGDMYTFGNNYDHLDT